MDGRRYFACSRREVETPRFLETATGGGPYVLVSICSADGTPSRLPGDANMRGVLRLRFDDADGGEGELFDSRHAELVEDFLRSHADVPVVAVHCDAGMSRSAGLAAALTKAGGGDDSAFFGTRTPNMRVYRVMLNTMLERSENPGNGAEKPCRSC